MLITSKGRANHLIKKSSKLDATRRAAKKYKADLTAFVTYQDSNPLDEETKEDNEEIHQDEMN